MIAAEGKGIKYIPLVEDNDVLSTEFMGMCLLFWWFHQDNLYIHDMIYQSRTYVGLDGAQKTISALICPHSYCQQKAC